MMMTMMMMVSLGFRGSGVFRDYRALMTMMIMMSLRR